MQVLYTRWWLNQFWSGGLGGVHKNKNASKNNKKKYKEKMVSMPSKFDDGFCFVQVWEKSKWECNAKNIWINEKKKLRMRWCFQTIGNIHCTFDVSLCNMKALV